MAGDAAIGVQVAVLAALVWIGAAVEDTFASVNSLGRLVETEGRLVDMLGHIIHHEEGRLAALKRYSSYLQDWHAPAAQDPESFVLNPLNAFHLLKRLTVISQDVEDLVMRPIPDLDLLKDDLDLPVFDDLNGASEALCRLQDTYHLQASDLAQGIISGKKLSEPMTASDAWEIARHMFDSGDHYHANLWLEVALDLDLQEKDTDPLRPANRSQLLDHRAYTLYSLGNTRKALALTEQYLELQPNCTRNLENRLSYLEALDGLDTAEGEPVKGEKERPDEQFWDKTLQLQYEMLCRGEGRKVDPSLVCRYTDNGHPFLRLGGVKVEEVSRDPPIVVFHDVLHDLEIEQVKALARPVIARSMVTNFTADGQPQWVDKSRVSQTAFLSPSADPVIARLDRRAGLLAGLSHRSAEDLQVLNYGIGGHYEPHYDHSDSTNPDRGFPDFIGNRIATLLFYMSDVEVGGATVFPDADVAVFPRKGSAVLWFNLLRDGVGDPRTRHAACPVLVGSKWACNKWFHEGMQEFRRPCLLHQDSLPVVARYRQDGDTCGDFPVEDPAEDVRGEPSWSERSLYEAAVEAGAAGEGRTRARLFHRKREEGEGEEEERFVASRPANLGKRSSGERGDCAGAGEAPWADGGAGDGSSQY